MKMTVESHASYSSMAFKRCADDIWNSLKTNTDEKFGKKRMSKSASIRLCLTIFLIAEFHGKRASLSNLGKKLQKKKKKREPRPNRVITVSALQATTL